MRLRSAIELHILHPRYGFPLIPPDRHRCTQALSLALGLPAKLGLLADVLEQANRKDAAGERLMHQMSKPRKPRKDEDPAGVYWLKRTTDATARSHYNVQDVEVEREADDRLSSLPDAEQKVWELSNLINARGFHVDRGLPRRRARLPRLPAPRSTPRLPRSPDGAVTGIAQIARLKNGCKNRAARRPSSIASQLRRCSGMTSLRRQCVAFWSFGLGGAQAAVKKLDALLARAGDDDRVRGAFRYHGASPGAGPVKVFSRKTSSAPRSRILKPRSPRSRPAIIRTSRSSSRSRSPSWATAAGQR